MKLGGRRLVRRSIFLAAACMLAVVLTACTGNGGGYLPPQAPTFSGQASFGFTFSCQRGDLKIELSYNDKGKSPLGSSFGIHGIVDVFDPVLESAVCIDEDAPPESEFGNQLIFLGRYRLTSGAPAKLRTCPTTETSTSPLCRFEVTVRDNDKNFAPSPGDYFSIKLSTSTRTPCDSYPPDLDCSELPAASVVYTRAGFLAGGNITVK
jgi:hypothetical protein